MTAEIHSSIGRFCELLYYPGTETGLRLGFDIEQICRPGPGNDAPPSFTWNRTSSGLAHLSP